MCILFIARNQHSNYPLVIAANRDEFHNRPTLVSHFWVSSPNLLAGKDEQGGGTWMGITKHGKLAALTNIRDPKSQKADTPSRGDLTCNWLNTGSDVYQYHTALQQTRNQYNGYNLVFGDTKQLWVYNNASDDFYMLDNGVFGLSNADIHTPWPKTTRGIALFKQILSHKDFVPDDLFGFLADRKQADDNALPNTGIDYVWKKRLSPIFITSPDYGTRASTLLLVDKQGTMTWWERSFDRAGNQTAEQRFNIEVME